MEKFSCAKNTVRNALERYEIRTPKGFFKREGSVIGRPKGIPHKKEWLEFMSRRMSGKRNGFYGRKHTKKTREKMSANHADIRGERNPFKRSLANCLEKREAHKKRCKNLWDKRGKEYRKKFGQKLSKALAHSQAFKDVCHHKNHRCGFIVTRKGGKIFCRNSWEKMVALELDKSKLVADFTLEKVTVRYTDEKGAKRFTRGDFLVCFHSGEKLLLEVKPRSLYDYGNNSVKIAAYRDYCRRNSVQFSLTENKVEELQKILVDAWEGKLYVS